MMRKNIIYLFLLIFIYSCSQEQAWENTADNEQQTTEEPKNLLLIEKDIIDITAKDAANVSELFFSQEKGIRSTLRSASNTNITTVTDSLSAPLFYIVNYPSGNGFVVISATKKYQPVLAYSDQGNFDINTMNDGVKLFFDSYKTTIQDFSKSHSDSLRVRYAMEWSTFEKPTQENQTKASYELQLLKTQEKSKWKSNGYEPHDFGAARYFMSTERFNGYSRDICARTHPSYNCFDANILLIKRYTEQTGPLMNTTLLWHQKYPFNIDAPNSHAGCVPIALAQIMKYHRWPSNYNWANIPEEPTPTAETFRLILDIRSAVKAKYYSYGTAASNKDAETAFRNFRYYANLSKYSDSSVITEIKRRNPVYVSGKNVASTSLGHAWVCDGYMITRVQYAAAILTGDDELPLHPGHPEYEPSNTNLTYTFFSGFTEISSEYFHMNWGWGEGYNGWFYAGTANPDSGSNYIKDRQMIAVSPNK